MPPKADTHILYDDMEPVLIPGKIIEARQLVDTVVSSLPVLGPILTGGSRSPPPPPPVQSPLPGSQSLSPAVPDAPAQSPSTGSPSPLAPAPAQSPSRGSQSHPPAVPHAHAQSLSTGSQSFHPPPPLPPAQRPSDSSQLPPSASPFALAQSPSTGNQSPPSAAPAALVKSPSTGSRSPPPLPSSPAPAQSPSNSGQLPASAAPLAPTQSSSTGSQSTPPARPGQSPSPGSSSAPLNAGSSSPSNTGSFSPSNNGSSPPSNSGSISITLNGGSPSPSNGASTSPSSNGSSSPSAHGSSSPSAGSAPSNVGSSGGSSNGSSSLGTSGFLSGSGRGIGGLPTSSADGGSGGGGNPSSLPTTTTVIPSSPTTDNGSSTGISRLSNAASGTTVPTGNDSNGSSSSMAQNGSTHENSSVVSSSGSEVDNIGGVPLSETIQSGLASSGWPPAATNTGSTSGSMGTGTNNGSSTIAGNKHRLSSGAIAAIVIALLFLIFLSVIVFILRRRSKIQSEEHKNRWWFTTSRSSQTYRVITHADIMPAGTQTARSSIGTTVDQHESNRATYAIPPLPPATAEMRRGRGTFPALIINTYNYNSSRADDRFSIGSSGSGHSQYIIVPNRSSVNTDLLCATTPMSVRPFSPSESFAFPKPPKPAAGSVAIGSSRPSSTSTSVLLSPTSFNACAPPRLSLTHTFPLTVPWTIPDNNDSPSLTMARTPNPFADNNSSFEDFVSSDITSQPIVYPPIGAFSDIEIVRRPFIPILPDELAVRPDDAVRMLHIYDDGWALVQRVVPSQSAYGEEKEEKGLIPIDCLREHGQELPAFITSKRVSVYGEPCAI